MCHRAQKNYFASPLLRLPPAIRAKILDYLIGGQVVHVQYVQHESGTVEQVPLMGKLRHAICVARETEAEAYARAIRGYHDANPLSDSKKYYIACCADRHQKCYFTSRTLGLKNLPAEQKFDLAVLSVCWQVYEEACHILWTTNTFSFDDPVSFHKFIASLNTAQLHKLTSLHLSRLLVGDQRSTTRLADRIVDHWAWTIACDPSRMITLRGLRTLHLCFEQWFDYCNLINTMQDYNRRCIRQDAQPFLQLRILDLERVTVVVADNTAFMKIPGTQAVRWTAPKKNEMAGWIRGKLLDVEGRASLKAEGEAKKLEIEGKRLDQREGVERRKMEKAKARKVLERQAEVAQTEAVNRHLERQIGRATRRSWMK